MSKQAKRLILRYYNNKYNMYLDVSNVNEAGGGIARRLNTANMFIIEELGLVSNDKNKFKLFFELTNPNFQEASLNFALSQDDYDYLLTLVSNAIDNEDYDFLETILSNDLPISIYKEAYRLALNDQDVKDLIWNKIALEQTVLSQFVDKQISDISIDRDIARTIREKF